MGNCCKGSRRGSASDSSSDIPAFDRRRTHPMVRKVKEEADFALILKENKIVIVDFYAPWCGPCQIFSPQVERFAEEFADTATFVKINVDDCEELAMNYNVHTLPKFIIFKDGEDVDEFQGVNAEQLKHLIILHTSPPPDGATAPPKPAAPPATAAPPAATAPPAAAAPPVTAKAPAATAPPATAAPPVTSKQATATPPKPPV